MSNDLLLSQKSSSKLDFKNLWTENKRYLFNYCLIWAFITNKVRIVTVCIYLANYLYFIHIAINQNIYNLYVHNVSY